MGHNIILLWLGIILGHSEPCLNINAFLSPLVDEFLILWNDGVRLNHSGSLIFPELFRASLLCVACGISASRKVCGFTQHNSKHGRNKCTKEFDVGGIGDRTDYSGFEHCRSRNIIEHGRQVDEIMQQTTQEDRSRLESSYGARYSELLRLPYFDVVRFTVVDPMHNLFLGTAKNMVNMWMDSKALNTSSFSLIQDKVDASAVPSNMGRLPTKIAKSFVGFTAEQWKTWVVVFSSYALFEYLPADHYSCWILFIQACRILCSPTIRITDVGTAHELLMKFCRSFETVYGPSCVTPNMHLHSHLADCVLDYGPIYSFWLFSFERYNGVLGDYHTNNKSIEIQVMRKFLKDQELGNLEIPQCFQENFKPLINSIKQKKEFE